MEANSTLLAYYGDDLTGSTDVMEALASQGVDTVLFLKIPDAELFSHFRDRRAFGLAGTSRSETPEWMETHLVPAFSWLKSLDAAFVHYKVCSTFDSSPNIGNIGKAIEIGRNMFGAQKVPLVVGAPQIRRYTAFGNLFAAYGAEIFRIDRHPVMSRHPVTPMDEADLRLHLAGQTSLQTGLVNLAQLRSPQADSLVDTAFAGDEEIVLLDVDGDETQQLAGAQMWRKRDPAGQFTCGSSGVEYALMREWQRLGIAEAPQDFPSPGPVDRLAVVSGSVSPTTERQIRHALDNGFRGIALDPLEISVENADAVVAKAVKQALEIVNSGESVILYTALGPSTNRGDAISFSDNSRHRLGENLGNILREIVVGAGLKRAVIAGGDTSSHALAKLGVEALTLRLPLPQTPGSPLCAAYSSDPCIDGMLVALKGGQVGGDDYFSMIRAGGPA
jgi:uncharacterized protein YgbK (DUF1537 family)